jgi:hypothetical protein
MHCIGGDSTQQLRQRERASHQTGQAGTKVIGIRVGLFRVNSGSLS